MTELAGKHIVSSFDADMKDLSRQISELGGLAERQLRRALDALQTRDVNSALEIAAADARLDEAEVALEESVIRTLATRQPLAVDLRETIAALKIASTLERIGDVAKSIARSVPAIAARAPVKIARPLVQMGHETLGLLSKVLDAYGARDADKAIEVWNDDVKIDETYNSLFRELTTYMMEDSRTVGTCALLLTIAKGLERVGDHATFIAEMIHFVVKGETLGDERPKGDPAGWMLAGGEGNAKAG